MTHFLDRNPGVRGALATWWHGLDHDRGARAELRRCRTPLEVMLTPAFHAARARLVAAGLDDAHEPVRTRIAAAIGLLAHVEAEGDKSPAEAFSESQDGRPPVSPLRFRRILAAQDDTELYRLIRRVLPLAPTLNFLALANDVLDWGDATRKRWVYAYHWPAKQEA